MKLKWPFAKKERKAEEVKRDAAVADAVAKKVVRASGGIYRKHLKYRNIIKARRDILRLQGVEIYNLYRVESITPDSKTVVAFLKSGRTPIYNVPTEVNMWINQYTVSLRNCVRNGVTVETADYILLFSICKAAAEGKINIIGETA
jgi:hypothetical protein